MVYLMLATGFEEIEALTVADVLRRADIDVSLVSCEETLMVTGAHKIKIEADIMLQDVSLEHAELIVLPGGMPGTVNLLENKELTCLLENAYRKEMKLAAICAAPLVFGKLGFLNGKKAVCYPGFEEELIGATIGEERVVRDGIITTSKGPGTALEFSYALVEWMEKKEIAEKLKGDMLAK